MKMDPPSRARDLLLLSKLFFPCRKFLCSLLGVLLLLILLHREVKDIMTIYTRRERAKFFLFLPSAIAQKCLGNRVLWWIGRGVEGGKRNEGGRGSGRGGHAIKK